MLKEKEEKYDMVKKGYEKKISWLWNMNIK